METPTNLTDALNARQNEYRYLVLDPLKKVASWNPLHADMLRDNQGSDALRRILRPDLAWSPEHCPILLLLASPDGTLDEALVRSSETYAYGETLYEKRYVCGWLSSALSPDEMAVWLADLCKHVKPGVSIPVFEPLRLELLKATANPELLAGLLASTSQWHWMSCTGELKTMSGRSGDDHWILNWGAEQAQAEVRNIWRLLSAWHECSGALPSEAVRLAADAWSASGNVGLHHLSDRLCLALNALTLPVDITAHAAVQTRLQEAAENPVLRFTQLLQTLPDAVWQDLRHA
ncbi:TPA: hypothetical protein ACI4DF_002285 [Enterobacter hormaechei]|nr:hypothetical protein [Enterobacter hormaechei]HAZ0556950.1 hypothetical protein [Enterobacter hormaechei]